jgi:16S rRNA (uracil1498-N3)-methyltransferase
MVLTDIDKDAVSAKVLKAYNPMTEPLVKTILFQGIPKSDKMDWIIQKTVELGVWKIQPMITQFSIPQLKGKSVQARLQRWNRIAREACKQSGRVLVPEVKEPIMFLNALNLWADMTRTGSDDNFLPVLCYEGEGKKCLKDLFKCYNIDCVNTIGVFIGPEGGFSSNEIDLAKSFGFVPVSLGKRILRTETAAIAVLSVVMHEMGEMR